MHRTKGLFGQMMSSFETLVPIPTFLTCPIAIAVLFRQDESPTAPASSPKESIPFACGGFCQHLLRRFE